MMNTGMLRVNGGICGECGAVFDLPGTLRAGAGDLINMTCSNGHMTVWVVNVMEGHAHVVRGVKDEA